MKPVTEHSINTQLLLITCLDFSFGTQTLIECFHSRFSSIPDTLKKRHLKPNAGMKPGSSNVKTELCQGEIREQLIVLFSGRKQWKLAEPEWREGNGISAAGSDGS